MAKTPLDILKEHNRAKKVKRTRGPLALLEDLNQEQRGQRQRDRLLDFFRQPLRPKKGTLIIGVKLVDGLVIASDRKVARGSETEYTNKVFEMNLGGPLLFAAEGFTGIRDDFLLLLDAVIQSRKGVDTLYEVKIIVEDIIANLTDRYADHVRESAPIGVLMGGLQELTKGPATLYYIHAPGYGELASFMCSGHGGSYAYSLAKFLINPNMQSHLSLEEAAKRAAFIITWISDDVDSTVGGIPQITILRNDNPKVESLPDDIIKAQERAVKENKSRLAEVLGLI